MVQQFGLLREGWPVTDDEDSRVDMCRLFASLGALDLLAPRPEQELGYCHELHMNLWISANI
jgi:hypothetical protein